MKFIQKFVCTTALCCLGLSAMAAGNLNRIVAVVNDNVITSEELNEQVRAQQAELKQRQLQEPAMNVLQQHVLKRMVDVEVQLQLAKVNGIEVDNEEVEQAIKRIAEANKVSVTEMKQRIEAMGETWANYKRGLRKEILLSQLQQRSVGQIKITDDQVNDYIKANKNQAKLQYHVEDLLLGLPEAPSSDQLALKMKQASELMARLNKDLPFQSAEVELPSGKVTVKSADLGTRSLASLPQMFAERVVSMKQGEISGPIRAANGLHMIKLTAIAGDQAPQIATVYHVEHILLKSLPNSDGKKSKQMIDKIAAEIKSGKNFEMLAKKYSEDLLSAKQGGDLGWLHSGETVPEFEQAFKQLKPGQVSKPIKSSFGWHLIKYLGSKDVDDAQAIQKQQIKQALYQSKFNQAVEDWLVHVKSSAYVKTYL